MSEMCYNSDMNSTRSYMPPVRTTPRSALGAAAVALFVAAANLRPAIAAVAPLVGRIQGDLRLSAAAVALLTTVPTLAMGICAPLGALVGRRLGLHRGVLLGLGLIAVASAARGLGESTWTQLGAAAVVGAGIAIAQTLLPGVVKARFADRAGLVTGIYTAGLGLGGAVAAGVSAPVADAIGSWPGALASWTVLAVAGMIIWQSARQPLDLDNARMAVGPVTRGLPWRDSTAWRITALSAVNSALYYCELAWLVQLLHDDAHYDATSGGALLTAMISIQVVAMLAIPALLGEHRDRRVGLAVTTVLTAVGFAGLAAAPQTALPACGLSCWGLATVVCSPSC